MPVFRSGKDEAPAWCQMQFFDIVRLEPGQQHSYARAGKMEKLIVGGGRCLLSVAGREQTVVEGANINIGPGEAPFSVLEVYESVVLVRMCGQWGQQCGGSGLFRGDNVEQPQDRGDAVDYEKTTNFDSHYHDCDEYWIIYEGAASVVSESKSYAVTTGDCVATGMGFHHDMPTVSTPVRAVYFETTLEGRKRRGHLWDHEHGVAEPRVERV